MNKRRIQPDIQEGGWEVWESGDCPQQVFLNFLFYYRLYTILISFRWARIRRQLFKLGLSCVSLRYSDTFIARQKPRNYCRFSSLRDYCMATGFCELFSSVSLGCVCITIWLCNVENFSPFSAITSWEIYITCIHLDGF